VQPPAQTFARFALHSGYMVCCALFFVASDEKSRQKKNKLPRFFLSRLSRSVVDLFFVSLAAGMASDTQKKVLARGYGHLITCGGQVWPCLVVCPPFTPVAFPRAPTHATGGRLLSHV
jgi:hypothetical protein